MNLIYNTGIRLYGLAARMVSGRNAKASKMLAGQRETISRLRDVLEPGRRYLWVHAASLGEFEQGRPLMERLRREHPDLGIALTFFSPSGYEVRKNFAGADVVCYLPFDTPSNAEEFVSTLHPVAAIFVKYEFWGNYLQTLHRHKIPTFLISAIFRDSQPFFKWWGGTFRTMLRCYDHVFVQDDASARRLASVGVKCVSVAGDTRFDRVTDILNTTVDLPQIVRFKGDAPFTLVVGSSWEADEDVYLPWINAHPETKVIIAPHEFYGERLDILRSRIAGKVKLFSEIEHSDEDLTDVRAVIVDCFGKLASIYRYGDAAYIGGGFGVSIHNINEAAVYGIPVMFGPRHRKFKEAFDLIDCGGGFTFASRQEFEPIMERMATDGDWRAEAGQRAGDYIKRNLGATDKVYTHLKSIL